MRSNDENNYSNVESRYFRDSIPPGQLRRRGAYRIRSRNLEYGIFDGHGFIGIRTKFGDRYLDTEWLATPDNFGTAVALQLVEMLPKPIACAERTDGVRNNALFSYLEALPERLARTENQP